MLENKDLYRLMVRQASGNAIFMLDKTGCIATWNEGVAHHFGYQEEEFVGRSAATIFTPEDRSAGVPEMELAEAGRQGFAFDDRWHLRKDGSRFWATGMVNALYDDEGRLLGFVKVIQDRTEWKEAQEARAESEAKYRSLLNDVLDTAGVGIIILDADFHVVWLNRAMERYFGLKRDEVIGMDKRRLIQTGLEQIIEEPEAFAAKLLAAYDDNSHVERFEVRVRPGTGREPCWLEHWSQPIRSGPYAGGRIEHYTNLTARKELEEDLRRARDDLELRIEERTKELRESEVRFATAFQASPAPIYIFRLEDLHYLDVNESFLEMMGYSRDEVVGRSLLELRVHVDTEERDAAIRMLRQGREVPLRELQLRTKSGQLRYVLAGIRPIPIGGVPCGLGSFADITARKRTEQDIMTALQAVLQDTTALTSSVMEKLAQLKVGGVKGGELSELTERERQVLTLVAQGMSNQQIAAELGISPQTVRNYMSTIYQKLNVHSRAEAVVWARERGLGSLPSQE